MATLIEAIAEVNNASFGFERWQYTLLMLAFLTMTIAFNTWGAKALPRIETLSLFGHIGGLLITIIPVLVLAPKNSAKQVFTEVVNNGGWSNTGTSCLIAQISVLYCNLGECFASSKYEDSTINVSCRI